MNNMSIAMGKRQLVDSIWKSAGIEGLGTTFPKRYYLTCQYRQEEMKFFLL